MRRRNKQSAVAASEDNKSNDKELATFFTFTNFIYACIFLALVVAFAFAVTHRHKKLIKSQDAELLRAVAASLAANETAEAYSRLHRLHPSSIKKSANVAIVAAVAATEHGARPTAKERKNRIKRLQTFEPEKGQLARLARAYGDGLAGRSPRKPTPLKTLDRPRLGGWIGEAAASSGGLLDDAVTGGPEHNGKQVVVLNKRPLVVMIDGFVDGKLLEAAAKDINSTVQKSLKGGDRRVCVNPHATDLLNELKELSKMDGYRRKDDWATGPAGAPCAKVRPGGKLDARVGSSSWSISYVNRHVSEAVDELDGLISEALGVGSSEEEADAWTTESQGLYYPVSKGSSDHATAPSHDPHDHGAAMDAAAIGGGDEARSYQLHVDCEDFGEGVSAMRQQNEPGDRAVSALLYLTTPLEGGATRFPLINNLEVKPLAGRLLLFETLTRTTGYCDPLAAHIGEAPSAGEVPKLVLQKWVFGSRWAPGTQKYRMGAGVKETATTSHIMCDVNTVCRTFMRPL